MKTELEKIKLEFNERIDSLLKKCVDPPKTEFEVGKWYKLKDYPKVICFAKELVNGELKGFGVSHGQTWSDVWFGKTAFDSWTPATESEVKEALIKEAEKRGFKKGVMVIDLYNSNKTECNGPAPNFVYDSNEDDLYFGGPQIYKQGKWATIVKEEAIKIGGYEVKFYPMGETRIDGNLFTRGFWEAAKTISEHSKAKIMIGCSKQFDVSLDTINQILEKLK